MLAELLKRLNGTGGRRQRRRVDEASWAFRNPDAPGDLLKEGVESRPLRVLHVTEAFWGGAGTAIIEYAAAIRAQGIESSLIAQDRGSGLLGELGNSSPFTAARIVAPGLLNLSRAIGTAVEDLRPDILHLHSSLAGGVGRIRLRERGGPPVVYSPHCFAFERRDISPTLRAVYRLVEYLLARRTSAFVCVSPHEEALANSLRSRADVVHLVNYFDRGPGPESRRAAGAVGDGVLRVITVGRVAPQKDPEMFRQVVLSLRASGTKIDATWVGNHAGSASEALEASDITVTGWKPAREVADSLAEHSIYLHTASWEAGPPIALLEALHAGLAIVARRNPAYRSIVPDEWQFDDVAGAVEMIGSLSDPVARQRRVREQLELVHKLRRNAPEVVLAKTYDAVRNKLVAGPPSVGYLRADGVDQVPGEAVRW